MARVAGPLRGRKRSMYEGGHRVPGIARWPGTIMPGSTTDLLSVKARGGDVRITGRGRIGRLDLRQTEVRLVAFVTDNASITRILEHLGEPTRPLPLSPARSDDPRHRVR